MTRQTTYGARFLERAIQRPRPPRSYAETRLTDAQIGELPEPLRPLAITCRAFGDHMNEAAVRLRTTLAR